VVIINLIRKLSAGDADLLGVYDHDVIAHVHMRAIVRLMLTLEAMGDLGRKAAQRLTACVDQKPITADCAGLGEHGRHRKTPPKKAGKCT